MVNKFYSTLAAVVCLSVSAAYAQTPVVIHGSTTVSSAVMLPKQAEIEAASGAKLTIVSNGSGRGIIGLAEGTAKIGMISSPLEGVVSKAEKDSPAVKGKDYKATQIGVSKVAFIVNPANTVKKLTNEQIADILLGKIKNWSEVGGKAEPIMVVIEDKKGGIRSMVESDLLAKQDVAAEKREVPNGSQIPNMVAQLPNALGVATVSAASAKVVVLETSKPIQQPLILVTLGAPTPDLQKIIDAASKVAPK